MISCADPFGDWPDRRVGSDDTQRSAIRPSGVEKTDRRPRVAIIGGGVAGLAAAAHVAEAGCPVTVIERGSIACGSSSLSAGVYSEGTYSDPLNIAMRRYAVEELRAMRKSHDLRLNEIGFLRPARDLATLETYQRGADLRLEAGILDTRIVCPVQMAEIIPTMNCDPFVGGLWAPRDGYLDGYELATVYAARAKARGARLMLRTELTGSSYVHGTGHLLDTTNGVVTADIVVNAAGAWASDVGDVLGAPIEIIAQRHQICVVNTKEPFGFTLPEVMDNVPGTGEVGLWFRQERADQLLAGLHSNDFVADADREDANNFDRGVDDSYVDTLIELLMERLPAFDMSLHSGWAGLYPHSPDGRFVIGPAPECSTVIQACGTGGVGVNTSPAIGRLVADWILEGYPSISGAAALAPSSSRGRTLLEAKGEVRADV